MFKSSKITASHQVLSAVLGSALALACSGAPDQSPTGGGTAQTGQEAQSAPTPPSPALAVPDGNKLAFSFDAVGVQIYTCSATATGYGWVFKAPEATLYADNGNAVGSHYAGPTWEYQDGSKVVGKKVAGFVTDPTAIPALLLIAVSHEGDGRMTDVTFIQRLDTVGGIAPASGCDATTVGTLARVDYTATYYFYKATGDTAETP